MTFYIFIFQFGILLDGSMSVGAFFVRKCVVIDSFWWRWYLLQSIRILDCWAVSSFCCKFYCLVFFWLSLYHPAPHLIHCICQISYIIVVGCLDMLVELYVYHLEVMGNADDIHIWFGNAYRINHRKYSYDRHFNVYLLSYWLRWVLFLFFHSHQIVHDALHFHLKNIFNLMLLLP